MPEIIVTVQHWSFITSPVRIARPMTPEEHRKAGFAPPLNPRPAPGTAAARALTAYWMEKGTLGGFRYEEPVE